MAITVPQAAVTANTTGTSANLTAFASALTAGSIILVAVRTGNTGVTVSVSDNKSNIYATDVATSDDSAGTAYNTTVFSCKNPLTGAGSAPTLTVAQSGASQTIRAVAYEVNGVNALDQKVSPMTQANTASPSAGPKTIIAAAEFIFQVFTNDLGAGTVTINSPGGSLTVTQTNLDQKINVGYSISTATGAYTAGATSSAGAENFTSTMATYYQAASTVQRRTSGNTGTRTGSRQRGFMAVPRSYSMTRGLLVPDMRIAA